MMKSTYYKTPIDFKTLIEKRDLAARAYHPKSL